MRMKTFVAAAVAAASLAVIAPASAADMSPRMVTKAPAPVVAHWSWNGFYVGGSLGARWANVDGTTTGVGLAPPLAPPPFPATATASYDSTTFRAGGYAGFNWQFAPNWLTGIEADIAWGDGEATNGFIPGLTAAGVAGDSTSFRHLWDAGVRGRIGYLVDPNWLLFISGGVQWQKVEASLTCGALSCPTIVFGALAVGGPITQTNSTTRVGWTLGGGVEARLGNSNWLARAEYRYADFGTWGTDFGVFPQFNIAMDYELHTHTLLAGLAYKF